MGNIFCEAIRVKGFDRYFTATTDSNGSFTYTFTPGANESGNYSIWAVHPDITTRTVQSTFTIAGLSISPATANVKMLKNKTIDIPVTINNYGEAPLTGLRFATVASPGITAEVINPGDSTLTAGEQAVITLRLTASSTVPDTSTAAVTIDVNEGLQKRLDAMITLVSAIPVIATNPSYIDTGIVRGSQKVQTFTVTNTGMETLKNARIEGPSLTWLSLTTNKTIGDIPAGSSANTGIIIKPSETIPQGVYDDRITIYSDNHIPYTYNIQVTITSNAVGNVLFDVLNIFSEDVPNATITLQHQQLLELTYTVKTGPDGTAMAYDIPEGKYTFVLSPPPGHLPASGTFLINPGITTPVYIALDMKLVDISWSVVPTVIEDRYEIKVSQTFETNVPVPVLVTEPPVINIPEMKPGEVVNGEFNVKNYGLIAAENVKIDFPRSFLDHDIEVFTSVIPNKIGAMQTITVPFKITRRQTVAGGQWSEAGENLYACNSITDTQSLYDEVQGYGGSQCTTSTGINVSGNYTKCPNTPQQSTGTSNTSLTLAFQQTCPTPTTTAGTYIPPTTTGSYGGGGGSGQTTGSGQLPPQSSIIPTPGDPCACKNCDDNNMLTCDKCENGSCKHGGVKISVNQSADPMINADGTMSNTQYTAVNIGDIQPTTITWTLTAVDPKASVCNGWSMTSYDGNFNFGDATIGGEFKLEAKPFFSNCGVPPKTDTKIVNIKGTQPDINDVKAELQKYGYYGEIVDQYIMCRESQWRHFKSDGTPKFGAPNGWGIMQIDPPVNCQQVWNWKENIKEGIKRLKEKETAAKTYFNGHKNIPYTNEQLLRETLSRYNGGSYYKVDNTNADPFGKRRDGWVRRDIMCDMCNSNAWNSGTNATGECKISGICYVDLGCR